MGGIYGGDVSFFYATCMFFSLFPCFPLLTQNIRLSCRSRDHGSMRHLLVHLFQTPASRSWLPDCRPSVRDFGSTLFRNVNTNLIVLSSIYEDNGGSYNKLTKVWNDGRVTE